MILVAVELKDLFPQPAKEPLINSCKKIIQIQLNLRKIAESRDSITWKTAPAAIEKIKRFVDSL